MAAPGSRPAVRALLAVLLVLHTSHAQKSSPLSQQQLQDWAALSASVGRFGGSAESTSRLVIFGTRSIAVVQDFNSITVAAARYGAGRLVHFGHEAFLGYPAAASGAARLVQNSLSWASGKATAIRIADAPGVDTSLKRRF
jgi:hypothetical protein